MHRHPDDDLYACHSTKNLTLDIPKVFSQHCSMSLEDWRKYGGGCNTCARFRHAEEANRTSP